MASPHKHVNPIPDWAESAPVDWVLRNAARDGLVEVVQNQLRLGCKVDSPDVVRKPTALAPHAQRCCASPAAGERPGLTLAGCGVPLSERPHCAAARRRDRARGRGSDAARGQRRHRGQHQGKTPPTPTPFGPSALRQPNALPLNKNPWPGGDDAVLDELHARSRGGRGSAAQWRREAGRDGRALAPSHQPARRLALLGRVDPRPRGAGEGDAACKTGAGLWPWFRPLNVVVADSEMGLHGDDSGSGARLRGGRGDDTARDRGDAPGEMVRLPPVPWGGALGVC